MTATAYTAPSLAKYVPAYKASNKTAKYSVGATVKANEK